MTILEQVEKSAAKRYGAFSPKTTSAYFALRLATKLGERKAVEHFIELLKDFPEAQILTAYRRTVAHCPKGDLARLFHEELEHFRYRDEAGDDGNGKRWLLAIRIERRAVGFAAFQGDHLSYAQSRQLSSSSGKAISSAVAFIESAVEKCSNGKPIRSAALESIPNGHEIQRSVLHQQICQTLTELSVTVMEVPRLELLDAFAHPALRSRKELRGIASEIWPVLSVQPGGPWTHDAAMLGLYVQTEVLFNIN
jgi:hypothetical protein